MADDVIADALEQFDQSQSGSSFNRDDALRDIEFARLGRQWPDKIAQQRKDEGRPCLTINRLPSFIRQVVNDSRQNSPAIVVSPGDDETDVGTAKVYGGLIKAIERRSNAAVAYDTALECGVTNGFGFFRITTDYASPDSFDMEARIDRVANPFSVHWDVSSTRFDASDWGYAFVSEMLDEDEFKARYPKGTWGMDWDAGRGDSIDNWVEGEKIRVAEYWSRTQKTRKILLLSDGRVVRESALREPIEVAPGVSMPLIETLMAQNISPVREREAKFYEVKRRVLTPGEILEETDWPGELIPICPVWGEEVLLEGRRYFRSLVRDAIDPQQMFNFWRSASTELVALAPRAPWVVAKGSIPADQRAKWETANTRSHAYLEWEADGGRNPMPQRQAFAGVPAGAIQEALNASDDMKAIMGIYDASLGARSNETSGRAIMARQREGDVSTFHFIDNLSRAIQYAGRVLVEIIPSIYNQRQAITILGPDDAPQIVQLRQPGPDGKTIDLAVGSYDVTVKTGPSTTTQREEAVNALVEIMRQVPAAAPVLGDILLKNMDWPGADQASERLKAMLPPQIAQAEQARSQGQLPPEAVQAISAKDAELQQAKQQLAQVDASQQEAEKLRSQADMMKAQADIERAGVDRMRVALEAAQFQLQTGIPVGLSPG